MFRLETVWRESQLMVLVASTWLIFGLLFSTALAADPASPVLANGVKIGEVTHEDVRRAK